MTATMPKPNLKPCRDFGQAAELMGNYYRLRGDQRAGLATLAALIYTDVASLWGHSTSKARMAVSLRRLGCVQAANSILSGCWETLEF